MDTIRVFVISKLAWIKQQQKKLRSQVRETPRDYIDRESHNLWGKRYLLKIIEKDAAPVVTLNHSEIILQTRFCTDFIKREAILEEWYRRQLKQAMLPLFAQWQEKIGVTASQVMVQKMKTKWGSCTPSSGIIRINLELVKKPSECLEYIIVHELVHLLEATHNSRFVALMDKFLPKWQFHREELNQLPVRHENWQY
jgi:predicted metal-dependent hydrolase